MDEKEVCCDRCSACCYYILDGKLKKCKHLVKLESGNGLCRVYNNDRVGRVIDISKSTREKVICTMRKDSVFDYRGCPYNTGKPYFEDWCKDHVEN